MNRPHVVIADGDAGLRNNLDRALRQKGFTVTAVESGDHLLGLVQARDVAVVLVGDGLPGLEWGEAVPRILAARPGTRAIVVTARADDDDARRALAAGAFDYLCKPCDLSALTARIIAAATPAKALPRERLVSEIMIPIDEYTCVQASSTVREGMIRLKAASENFISSGLIMECGHRAVLVFDGEEPVGVLTMRNLIQAILPEHLVTPAGAVAEGLRHSPLFWSGLFNARVRELEGRCVREIMNPRPPVVDHDANLMRVAQVLCEENRRRVAVRRDGRIVGVVREQELFHEMSRIMLARW